jgi:predicted acyltransferase
MAENTPLNNLNNGRYRSLDVLRGLTVALMIVVNTPGSWSTNFAPFLHASWHGFTITDLVFPSFLFVVGNAMSFSLRKLQQQGNHREFLKKVGKRTVLIFLIGLLLSSFPFIRLTETGMLPFDFSKIRVMGVLQRIALCYALAAVIIYFFKIKGALVFTAFSLLAYWFLMYFFGEGTDPYGLEGNAARRLDLYLIGPDNLYRGEGIPFDPEGLLSTLPATVNVMAGYLVGVFIQRRGNTSKTVLSLLLAALVLLAAGYLWDIWLPINKKIWTSSFVLITVGYSTLGIAVLMYFIEVLKFRGWTYFFEVFGKNPLILYVLSGVFVRIMLLIKVNDTGLKTWIFENLFLPFFQVETASLFFALSYMLLIWLIGLWMDRRKIYIKV